MSQTGVGPRNAVPAPDPGSRGPGIARMIPPWGGTCDRVSLMDLGFTTAGSIGYIKNVDLGGWHCAEIRVGAEMWGTIRANIGQGTHQPGKKGGRGPRWTLEAIYEI